jgi:hypothetical protein
MKPSPINKVQIFMVLAALLFCVTAKAQTPATPATLPTYVPGDTIKITVTFDGPDAGKVVCAFLNAQLTSAPDPNQPNFSSSFGASECKLTAPNTAEISCKISDTILSGEYQLTSITATVKPGKEGNINYGYAPSEFPALKFKITNSITIKKPGIKSVTVLPKT